MNLSSFSKKRLAAAKAGSTEMEARRAFVSAVNLALSLYVRAGFTFLMEARGASIKNDLALSNLRADPKRCARVGSGEKSSYFWFFP